MMSSPPSQFNYPLPKVAITASQVGTRISVLIGGSFQQDIWVELNNESPYVLSIFSAQGILLNSLQPQIVDIAQIPSGNNSFIIVPNLLIPQASPSSEVDINVYPFGKPEGAYPFPLGRQAAPTARASDVGFTTAASFSPGASLGAGINLFNPANSSIIATIYAARITMVVFGALGVQTPVIEFGFNAGADNAFGAAGNNNPVPNDTGGSAATLKGSAATNVVPPAGSIWEAFQPTATGTDTLFIYDFIPFPDQKKLRAGTNAWIIVFNVGAAGILVGFALKHTEQ